MAVFVDDAMIPYRGMKMSHLYADTLEELLAMVDKIGVARRWLQQPPKASWVHFDVAASKRELAIRHGAVAVGRLHPVAFRMRQQGRHTEAASVDALAEAESLK